MPTILLVEDDNSIASIYKLKLGNHGFRVLHANNGLEGIRLAAEAKPDLILLDLMMPVMDGATFLEKLRKKPDFVDTPVLVLTNVSREEAPKTLWHLGIQGYFVKAHHTPAELVEVIDKTLTTST